MFAFYRVARYANNIFCFEFFSINYINKIESWHFYSSASFDNWCYFLQWRVGFGISKSRHILQVAGEGNALLFVSVICCVSVHNRRKFLSGRQSEAKRETDIEHNIEEKKWRIITEVFDWQSELIFCEGCVWQYLPIACNECAFN